MKVSLHKGRAGKDGRFIAGHNDRTKTQNAEHIDRERSKDNSYQYYDFKSGEMKDFPKGFQHEDYEKNVYRSLYSGYVEAQNERNIKARHAERNKTTDDYYKSKKNTVEELILQVGDKDEHLSDEQFKAFCKDFVDYYNKTFSNTKIICSSVHVDEATPHAHLRCVYFAEDEEHNLAPSQTKALEQMGISLPEPDKKESRYNNRQQTFTANIRQNAIDIARKLYPELDIESTPIEPTKKKHQEKQDYILEQKTEAVKKIDNTITLKREEIEGQYDVLESLNRKLEDKTGALQILSNFVDEKNYIMQCISDTFEKIKRSLKAKLFDRLDDDFHILSKGDEVADIINDHLEKAINESFRTENFEAIIADHNDRVQKARDAMEDLDYLTADEDDELMNTQITKEEVQTAKRKAIDLDIDIR